jgi:hypothetical protein
MANVTYTVPNKSGSYDGDMVVKQYTSMTIDAGDTVTVDHPCRGMFILVQGDCTINGTLSMLGKGAGVNPGSSGGSDNNPVSGNGLRFPFLKSGSSDSLTVANTLLNGCGNTARSVIANFRTLSSNGVIKTISQQGANGAGAGRNGTGKGSSGASGSNSGNTLSSGEGGGGGAYNATAGHGSYGSCFVGGSGGGGADNSGTASNATTFGRAGGDGNGFGGDTSIGGAGNPNGNNGNNGLSGKNYDNTPNGGGGLIVLVVGGNLTIGASGIITAQGQPIEQSYSNSPGNGGSSGGGSILLAYRGTYSNSGSVTADGGVDSGYNGYGGSNGGDGGNGSVHTLQIN